MRPKFLTRLIVCLVPTLIALGFAAHAFWKESEGQIGFRRGIDLAGGTILVFEVDRERMDDKATARGEGKRELTSEDIKQLAEKLKKRIDPTDLKNVVVRPIGKTRVEIILPFAGSTGGNKEAANEEFVQDVRNQVKQTGVLEFRILANLQDDREGIAAAQQLLDNPSPGDTTIADRAKAGRVPPAPTNTFKVKASGDEIEVRYEWVELGPEERESMMLSNVYKDQPTVKRRNRTITPYYHTLARARGKTQVHGGITGDTKTLEFSSLIYSRNFVKQAPTKDEIGKDVEYFFLTRVSTADNVRVVGDVRITAQSQENNGKPGVSFSFKTPEGVKMFHDMTERNKPTEAMVRSLAIIMDDKIVSAPTLNSVLNGSGTISGDSFNQKAVNQLVNILRSGNLNAELKPDPVSENTVGATLGESTIRKGLISVFASFAAVLIFMVYYYRFAGLVACIALFANLLLTIGFMVGVNAAFTLPGLAGLVLMLGMAVDANVLIYERIREEREKGATLIGSIRNGYDRALPTIIDTHLTSIFTSIVMYIYGNDNLRGFSISLIVGLVISLFTSLFMTRLMFDYSMHRKWVTKLTMKRLFARPTFDFMKIRNKMFILTAVVSVLGLALFLFRGEKSLNIDFTQGTAYGGRLQEGQERSLGGTGGKLGMVDLLGEERQKQRLNVKEIVPLQIGALDENGEPKKADNIFKIVYIEPDGKISEEKVTLANRPEGKDDAERLANLKSRASGMPDVSVEQVFLKGDSFSGNQARSFTVRTTEKEPELVQIMLDRLLRDEKTNDALLASTKITKTDISTALRKDDKGIEKPAFTATLTFDQPTSPGYFRRFVERELKLQDRLPIAGSATALTVTGIKSNDTALASEEERTGRYKTILLDFSDNTEFRAALDPKAKPEKKLEEEAALRKILSESQKSFESRPLPERLEVFDPALAASTRNEALKAVLLSWLAVLGFLWFRFGSWQFGLAAVICLIHDLCFTLGCIAVCHYVHDTAIGHFLGLQDFKIDLTAVAALLTLVGYSVNDTIVVFDRIREVRGKSGALTAQMINDSVNQTLSRTVLASLTVFLVVGVLYFSGGEGVHLFAYVMVVGVLVGTYSSIYIASPLLLIFGEGHAATVQAASAPPLSLSATAPSAVAD